MRNAIGSRHDRKIANCVRSRWSLSWCLASAVIVFAILIPVIMINRYPTHEVNPNYPDAVTRVYSSAPPMVYRWLRRDGVVNSTSIVLLSLSLTVCILSTFNRRVSQRPAGRWAAYTGIVFLLWWQQLHPEPPELRVSLLRFDWIWRPMPVSVRMSYLACATALIATAFALVRHHRWSVKRLTRLILHARDAQWFFSGTIVSIIAAIGALSLELNWGITPEDYVSCWTKMIASLAIMLAVSIRATQERPHVTDKPIRIRRLGVGIISFTITITVMQLTYLYRSPIYHFGVVAKGKIYRSGQPTYESLWWANKFYGFKTIINLHTPGKSSYWEDEVRFAREHNITLLSTDLSSLDALRVFEDPSAWPILVHCRTGYHRTTARLGVYWYACEGRSLDYVFQQIEQISGIPAKPKFVHALRKDIARLEPDKHPAGYCELPPPRLVISAN